MGDMLVVLALVIGCIIINPFISGAEKGADSEQTESADDSDQEDEEEKEAE